MKVRVLVPEREAERADGEEGVAGLARTAAIHEEAAGHAIDRTLNIFFATFKVSLQRFHLSCITKSPSLWGESHPPPTHPASIRHLARGSQPTGIVQGPRGKGPTRGPRAHAGACNGLECGASRCL